MSLLVDIMTNTLDESYAERARSRSSAGPVEPADRTPVARPWRRSLLPVVVLVALGMLTGTAVKQVRAREAEGTGLRADLAQQVRDRTAASDELAQRAQDLRDEVSVVQEQALGNDALGKRLACQLTSLGLASGTLAVRGPGIVVTLDDAPDPGTADGARPGNALDGRVQDRDLQAVVNGLWAAGAEAIAVNGQRLTALTAIRGAGEAVLVGLRPLSPPYVVQAIGDAKELEVEFLDGRGGRRLITNMSVYRLPFTVERGDRLSLPGAAAPDLPAAVPRGTNANVPSADEEGSP
jgi:uncharacterized protein YlxW (UPF0749 family)